MQARIITLMLAEMLGMGLDDAQDKRIRQTVPKIIDLILRSQKVRKSPSHQGGGAGPDARDADLSVTVWQLMSLRSAKNSGLKVPASSIEEAIGYLRRPTTPASTRRKSRKQKSRLRLPTGRTPRIQPPLPDSSPCRSAGNTNHPSSKAPTGSSTT